MDTEGKYRLLVIRSKYLKSTLKESESMFQKAYVEFTIALQEYLGHSPSPSPQPEKKETPKETKAKESPGAQQDSDPNPSRVEAKREEKDNNLKQVFRKIALQIHPDKLENSPDFEKKHKTALFEKARKSFENNDYYGIVEVAEQLGIDPPPPTKKQIELMKGTNKKLENKINEIKNTAVWNWYHGEEETRKLLLENYVKKLREIQSSRS